MPADAQFPSIPGVLSSDQLQRAWTRARRWDAAHPRLSDLALAGVLAIGGLIWLVSSADDVGRAAVFQLALMAPLIWRRRAPIAVFGAVCAVALFQWIFSEPLPGDVAVLIALGTVAARESTSRAIAASAVAEAGALMAALRWSPAGDALKSVVFLSGLVVAALSAGLALRTWRAYLDGVAERARRLEFERDQSAELAAAAERTRIAREMHDIVGHNVSVMVTLADGAALVAPSDPERAAEAMRRVSEAGRAALTDIRRTLGVLRSGGPSGALSPQPGLDGIEELAEGVRSAGLPTEVALEGTAFEVPPALALTLYRVVQESLTNTLRHAVGASRADITISYDYPLVELSVRDDGQPGQPVDGGHGLAGMRERVAMFAGDFSAGPRRGGGWEVAVRARTPALSR
jgi:signal transduction histidine kinase